MRPSEPNGRLTRLLHQTQSLAPTPPLLKLAVRGGLLWLTRDAVVIGEGWLGSRVLHRLPLGLITAATVEVAPLAMAPVRLRLCVEHGAPVRVEGVGPLGAARLMRLITILTQGAVSTERGFGAGCPVGVPGESSLPLH